MYRKVWLELICIKLVNLNGDFIYILGYGLMCLFQEYIIYTRVYAYIRGAANKLWDWCEKIGFIFKILQINFYRLPPSLPLPRSLYTTAYDFSIVQSSATGHQLTPCSADPPHRQTENEFLSTHFSFWGTGKSHRGDKSVE
jgi:hypothetical protein